MRSQHKFVITAGLLCHLFVAAPLVTSQALADLTAQSSAAPTEQATPSPTPVEPGQSAAPAASKLPIGNCHSVITSPPPVHQPAQSDSATQPEGNSSTRTQSNKKVRVPISEEHPVIIDARECEQAGKIYTLRGDVQIQFADYTFHGDLLPIAGRPCRPSTTAQPLPG